MLSLLMECKHIVRGIVGQLNGINYELHPLQYYKSIYWRKKEHMCESNFEKYLTFF